MSDTSIVQATPQSGVYEHGASSVPAQSGGSVDAPTGPAAQSDAVAFGALASQQRNTDRNSFKDYPAFDDASLRRAAKNESPAVKSYINALNERNSSIDQLDKVLAYQDSFEATGATQQQAQQFQDCEKNLYNKALHAELTANNLYVNAGGGDKLREHDIDKLLGMKDGKSPATGESAGAFQNQDLLKDMQDHFIGNHVFGAGMPAQNAAGFYS